jgi:hypothetical protein
VVLRRIFGPKRDEVTGEWRKLHTKELSSLSSIIRIIKSRRIGPCSTNEREEERLEIIGGKARGKEPLRRPKRRWVDNFRMDLGEVGWSDVDLIGLAKDRNRWRALVNSVLNLRVP